MSITFRCPGAPTKRVDCYCKQMEQECDRFCPGYMDESEAPELNLANMNALAMIRALGLEQDYCGDVPVGHIGNVRQRLLQLLNSESARSPHVRETYRQGNYTCNGIDDDYLRDRFERLDQLFRYAQEHNLPVSWD